MMTQKTIFSLSDVTKSIQKTLQDRYSSAFWVKAEMNKLNYYPHSGHCYPELVEKQNGRTIAEIRANLWKDDYNRINQQFLTLLKEPLKDGVVLLFLTKISYDPLYGLSLRILDIDPGFALGELEKEKQATISKIKAEDLFHANKLLPLATVPKRIAIISVETSKGLSDFYQTIDGNQWNYSIFHMLFPAILQGDHAAPAIIRQLNSIKKVAHHFDAVAIIRGGGGDVGLSCYNNYILVQTIASFPVPVFTGIGHSTNETVAEMVAYKNAITPTELGNFILQRFHNFSVPVQQAQVVIPQRARQLLQQTDIQLSHQVRIFKTATTALINTNKQELQSHFKSLGYVKNVLFSARQSLANTRAHIKSFIAAKIKHAHKDLLHSEKQVQLLNPESVLKRGYSISYINGKAVQSIQQLHATAVVETLVADGSFSSTITSIQEKPAN